MIRDQKYITLLNSPLRGIHLYTKVGNICQQRLLVGKHMELRYDWKVILKPKGEM